MDWWLTHEHESYEIVKKEDMKFGREVEFEGRDRHQPERKEKIRRLFVGSLRAVEAVENIE